MVVVVVVEVDSWPSIWGGVDGGEFRVSIGESSLFGEAAIAGSIASVFTFSLSSQILEGFILYRNKRWFIIFVHFGHFDPIRILIQMDAAYVSVGPFGCKVFFKNSCT